MLSYVCSICACLVLSVSSSSWCLGRAAACDCGTPWTFLLPFMLCFITVFDYVLFTVTLHKRDGALMWAGLIFEPLHAKPTKWHVRPAKTQISLKISLVRSVFAARSMVAKLSLCGQRRH